MSDPMKPTKAWALLRDGELYQVRMHRADAYHNLKLYRPGSKHKWRVVRVTVSETKQ